jgi:novobiocin biosynthesis protein NovU/D-mycarose 3-C-methyltransferase
MPVNVRCRACLAPLGEPFLDLGIQPPSNSFLRSPADFASEKGFPLAVVACAQCGLAQTTFDVPGEDIFNDDYVYVSATSEGVRAHAAALAEALAPPLVGKDRALVIEIASNDGTVLKPFRDRGLRVLGIEPSGAIAEMARRDGIETISEFFKHQLAARIVREHGLAELILARHVFAHVSDVRSFLAGGREALAPGGSIQIEVHYLKSLLEHLQFDTIYHEHMSYWAIQPLERLCAALDLTLVDTRPIDLHGGSILFEIQHAATARPPSPRLRQMRAAEIEAGTCDPATHRAFAQRVHAWRTSFLDLIESLARGGAKIVGYGAAAKANTALNFCPEVAKRLTFILDRNPLKQGTFTPGTHIPVVPADAWEGSGATHMLILAWNFESEIRRQMQAFAEGGGTFILPIPEPRIVTDGAHG